ncbi:hypothetical protein CALVIDRAFT_542286 [Calocera viscosa TUFC12733]|uniref:Uncharacterized protein n=1 Tax=Calocera viscosa (strain TUFC12733) TaxID=1330018 RepID=A0A167GUF4_CALVF|nr:hypothetical protein CALVIDRAFT_542286 [Calocera viscosa TUFC12733]
MHPYAPSIEPTGAEPKQADPIKDLVVAELLRVGRHQRAALDRKDTLLAEGAASHRECLEKLGQARVELAKSNLRKVQITAELIKMQRIFDLRSMIELIVSNCWTMKIIPGKTKKTKVSTSKDSSSALEPMTSTRLGIQEGLTRLIKVPEFQEELQSASAVFGVRMEDAIRCMNGLYHTLSKNAHPGVPESIELREEWFGLGDLTVLHAVLTFALDKGVTRTRHSVVRKANV